MCGALGLFLTTNLPGRLAATLSGSANSLKARSIFVHRQPLLSQGFAKGNLVQHGLGFAVQDVELEGRGPWLRRPVCTQRCSLRPGRVRRLAVTSARGGVRVPGAFPPGQRARRQARPPPVVLPTAATGSEQHQAAREAEGSGVCWPRRVEAFSAFDSRSLFHRLAAIVPQGPRVGVYGSPPT